MITPQKVVRFRLSSFLMQLILSLGIIALFWSLCIGLTKMGFAFPRIEVGKFFDLGFFSVSAFGLIIFLTMVPFQTVEGKLSPGFLSRIFKDPRAHIGLYILITTATLSFFIGDFRLIPLVNGYLSQLFIALVCSIIFAVILHRFWVIRCLYQPYVVYKKIKELKWEEPIQDVWLEIYECTFKAIKQNRIHDAMNLIDLMTYIFQEYNKKEDNSVIYKDLESLYLAAQELRPLSRLMELKWPFLMIKNAVNI